MNAAPYPAIPGGAQTGLLLFGAAFQGFNDGQFLAAHGIHCTVVDLDPVRIERMKEEYPTFDYHCTDAFEFVMQAYHSGQQWDVVSADPFSTEATRTLEIAEFIDELASMLCVIGAQHDQWQTRVSGGWHRTKRNESWLWLWRLKRVKK